MASSCYGASIILASSATETANNSGSSTVSMAGDPDPNWAPPLPGSQWISFTNSGNPSDPGFVSPPNGTIVTFTDTFTINGTPTTGALQVMADDTASVDLNGVALAPFAPTAGNTYYLCSDFTVGCAAGTTANLNLLSALQPGLNTLSFQVEQLNAVAFGVDYSGQIQYTPSLTSVPEPTSFGLLCLSCVSALWILRNRAAFKSARR